MVVVDCEEVLMVDVADAVVVVDVVDVVDVVVTIRHSIGDIVVIQLVYVYSIEGVAAEVGVGSMLAAEMGVVLPPSTIEGARRENEEIDVFSGIVEKDRKDVPAEAEDC